MIMIRVTRKLCRLKKNHDNIPRPNTSNRKLFESSNVRSYTRSFTASSRSSKNSQKMSFFKLSNYDCVGFDLDLSLVSYDINNVVRLSFELVSKFMVEKRGWDESLAASLLETDIDFLQKGLILDLEAGNILKIASDGSILRACHGTKFMSGEELEKVYPSRRWKETDAFVANPLEIWKDYWSLKLISLLDYFDMPVSLIFARAVDICDRKGETRPYKIWHDILDGLGNTFVAKNVKTDPSPFFLELKKNPEKYVNKQSLRTIDRLRELKKTKVTFLITGSYLDWVDLVSATALGHDWRELFDIVVCNAKKPSFFTDNKPFLKFSGIEESDKMEPGSLAKGGIYSQGNWAELEDFFRRETEKDSPKCLYVGDNLIQDVYCLGACTNCDTVVISGELQAERMESQVDGGSSSKIVKSEAWGSYFSDRFPTAKVNTLWCEIIEKYTKLCIPSLEFIVTEDFEREFQSFAKKGQETGGFYPEKPLSLRAS